MPSDSCSAPKTRRQPQTQRTADALPGTASRRWRLRSRCRFGRKAAGLAAARRGSRDAPPFRRGCFTKVTDRKLFVIEPQERRSASRQINRADPAEALRSSPDAPVCAGSPSRCRLAPMPLVCETASVPRESDFAVNSPAWDFRFHSASSASVRLPLRRGIARASHPMTASRSLLARCSSPPGATCRWPCAPGMPGRAAANIRRSARCCDRLYPCPASGIAAPGRAAIRIVCCTWSAVLGT